MLAGMNSGYWRNAIVVQETLNIMPSAKPRRINNCIHDLIEAGIVEQNRPGRLCGYRLVSSAKNDFQEGNEHGDARG